MQHPVFTPVRRTTIPVSKVLAVAALVALWPAGAQALSVFGSTTSNPSAVSSSSFTNGLVTVDFDYDAVNALSGGGTREGIVNGVFYDQVRQSGSGLVTTFTFSQLVNAFSGVWDLSYSSSTGLFTTGGTDGLTIQAFRGTAQVFSGCINGNIPTSGCATIDGQERVTYGISGVQFDKVQVSLLAPGQTEAYTISNLSVTPVPEPGIGALMLAGLGAIGFMGRRRKRD